MSLTGQTPQRINHTINNVGFWPALELSDFISEYRVPEQYNQEPLVNEIKTAVLMVNYELSPVAALFDNFSDIEQLIFNADDPDAQGDIDHHYKRAVFSEARAQLTTLFITTNRKDAADNAHDQWADTIEYWQCRMQQSIYYMIKRLTPEQQHNINDTFNHNGHMVAVI